MTARLALRSPPDIPGHFVGFLPHPVPCQTVEDVCRAEARFVEEVIARHPEAQGKPCLIGIAVSQLPPSKPPK